jgi:hypothetical protein
MINSAYYQKVAMLSVARSYRECSRELVHIFTADSGTMIRCKTGAPWVLTLIFFRTLGFYFIK